ncbi:MAG: cytochrome c [Pseudomonadota bacterium]
MPRLALAVTAAIVWSLPAAAGDPATPRQKELLYLLEQDCGSCHGLKRKGGLGPSLLPRDIADKPDEGLVDAILQGRPGTPMAPWEFEISEDEAFWLVRQLRKGKSAK